MTDFFLDHAAGSDAADGTTFANRWKTTVLGATAARIAAGDRIKIKRSPAPTSLGQNATFTNKDGTVSLAAAVTQTLYNDGAWASAGGGNVVCSTSTTRKQGSNSASVALAAGFGTGNAAYFATGLLDLSGYKQISFMLRQTAGTVVIAGDISLRLCSDTLGAVSVQTVAIPKLGALNVWQPVVVDIGSALPAVVNSIALYVDTDRGAQTFLIDNIVACKDATAADSLTHRSLIGKNAAGEAWYPIASIDGTTIEIDAGISANMGTTIARGYYGTTETVTIYKRECIVHTNAPVSNQATNLDATTEAGSAGNLITYSGGWDETNMTSQDDYTYIDCLNGFGRGFGFLHAFAKIERLIYVRPSHGINVGANDCVVDPTAGSVDTGSNGLVIASVYGTFGWGQHVCGGGGGMINVSASGGVLTFDGGEVISAQGAGFLLNAGGNGRLEGDIGDFFNCDTQGILFTGVVDTEIDVGQSNDAGQFGLSFSAGARSIILRGMQTSGNTSGAVNLSNALALQLRDCILGDSVEFTINNFAGSRVVSEDHDGVAGAQKIIVDGGSIELVSGKWRFAPTSSTRSATYPLANPLMRVAVKAGEEVTVSAVVNRSNTGLTAILRCRGGQVAGVDNDVIDTAAGSAGSPETLQITFTPDEDGVVEIEGVCYGGTTYTADFDGFDAV